MADDFVYRKVTIITIPPLILRCFCSRATILQSFCSILAWMLLLLLPYQLPWIFYAQNIKHNRRIQSNAQRRMNHTQRASRIRFQIKCRSTNHHTELHTLSLSTRPRRFFNFGGGIFLQRKTHLSRSQWSFLAALLYFAWPLANIVSGELKTRSDWQVVFNSRRRARESRPLWCDLPKTG